MQTQLLQAPARPATPPRVASVKQMKPIKPSVARSEDRRLLQRQERLVSAWLRSLTAR